MSFSNRGKQLLTDLRQKRKNKNAKPVFGPPPSNPIFEQKWLLKLNTHNLASPVRDTSQPRIMEKLARYFSTAIDLITTMHAEAIALDLAEEDFAYEEVPEIGGDTKPFDIVCINPFMAATLMAAVVDSWMPKLVQYENDQLARTLRTEHEKERLRKEFENLRVKIFEADEAGEWDTPPSETVIASIRSEQLKPYRPRLRRRWW